MAAPRAPVDLLVGLDDEQAHAVTTEAAPLCILAGAGSGKTRVLTRRIAHRARTGSADPRRVVALTFTRKAAAELRDRLRLLGLRDDVTAGTFHAIALAQLRAYWQENRIPEPKLLDRKTGFIAKLIPRAMDRLDPMTAVTEIEWAKARCIDPHNYVEEVARHDRSVNAVGQVASVFADYEQEKQNRRLVDFDDLLSVCANALARDRRFAEAQRWRSRHLFVDEFQDVNPLQLRLLRQWLGDSRDLCVVGDPNQAIYGWNGADASFLTDFASHFPGGEVVSLRSNYRSTPQVLATAAAALDHGNLMRPTRPGGPIPTLHSHASDGDEATAISREIRDARPPGGRWKDQAVLVRTNAQLALIEEALSMAGIPTRARGGSGLLDQPEVVDALAAMRASDEPFAMALRDLESNNISREDTDATPDKPALDRQANIDALVRLGIEYERLHHRHEVRGFESWLRATIGGALGSTTDAVELATFHAAKGLEWSVVHIAGLEHGYVPISHATTADALSEEHRLLYVAITRARDAVHLHWAQERTFGTRVSTRQPSPMLGAVAEAIAQLADGAHRIDHAERAAAARSLLRPIEPPTPAPEPVLDALRAWRTQVARAADVPAYVIFSDATLIDLARQRPQTAAELLDIAGIGQVKATRYGPDLLKLVAPPTTSAGVTGI